MNKTLTLINDDQGRYKRGTLFVNEIDPDDKNSSMQQSIANSMQDINDNDQSRNDADDSRYILLK